MNTTRGYIKAVRRDGKGFQLGDGKWYTCNEKDLSAKKGDEVEFNFVVNGIYNNCKGSIKKVESATPSLMAKPTGSTFGRSFPVAALAPERSIIRQNSLGHAVNVVMMIAGSNSTSTSEVAEQVIEVARMFEAYSAGDLDVEIADKEVSMMLAHEAHKGH